MYITPPSGKRFLSPQGKYLGAKAVRNVKNPCKVSIFPVQSDMVKGRKESLLRTLFFA